MNKKVVSKDKGFKYETARVVQFHRIADGKFVVSIWFGKETKNYRMTAFDITKEDFEKNWIVLN